MPNIISKFFRIAREGATTDGREITRDQIDQMAENYQPSVFGARIWLEHFRSLLPESIFQAYGDVVAVRAEDDEDGKRVLSAQLSPTAALIAINKERQKVYTSIEMDTSFSDSGQAYLVGLAVTDTPASLGTEMLAFSKQHDGKILQETENLFSKALEVNAADISGEAKDKAVDSLFTRVKALLSKNNSENADKQDDRFSDFEQSLTLLAENQQSLQDELADQSQAGKVTELTSELKALKESLATLTAGLSGDRAENHSSRPESTGTGDHIETDC